MVASIPPLRPRPQDPLPLPARKNCMSERWKATRWRTRRTSRASRRPIGRTTKLLPCREATERCIFSAPLRHRADAAGGPVDHVTQVTRCGGRDTTNIWKCTVDGRPGPRKRVESHEGEPDEAKELDLRNGAASTAGV